jgi:hypothetical protein
MPSFARVGSKDAERLIAVTLYEAGRVEGVDIAASLSRHVANPIRVFPEEGYDALRAIVSSAAPDSIVSVAASELVIPLDLRNHHIAAGKNFPAHAGETSLDKGPFLFPKISGFLGWLLGAWGESIPTPAISAYIDYARSAGIYLQPGDCVVSHGDYLGVIWNGVPP